MNNDKVRINTAYLDYLMEALKFATPQIHLPAADGSAPQGPSNEEKTETLRKKLYENDGTAYLTEDDLVFAYDAVVNYRKYLMKELPKHKKGSAKYNKTKKALDMIPKINATFFSTMVFS